MLYRSGEYRDAGDATKMAVSLETRDAAHFYHSRQIYSTQGESNKAVGPLEKVQEINPNFSLAEPERARVFQAQLTS